VTRSPRSRRLRHTPQSFPGLGDQAYVDPELPGKVPVRKGDRWIRVCVEYTDADRANVVELPREAVVKL